MKFEIFERMDGLVNVQANNAMIRAMRQIAKQLLEDGFNDADIIDFISHYAEITVDNVQFEMNEDSEK